MSRIHNDEAVIEALVRHAKVLDAATPESVRLAYDTSQSKYLFNHLILNDAAFKRSIDRPHEPRAFAAALKRIYLPLRNRGVILTLNGGGYLNIEKM